MLDVNTHRYLCSIIGLEPVEQAVEEIKGNKKNGKSCGSGGCQNIWTGLCPFGLGLAQWAQENSMSSNFQELRI